MKPLTHKAMKTNSKKADRIQNPPEFAVKFANAVFVLGLLFSVFVISLYVYRLFYTVDGPYPDNMIASVYKYYFTITLIGLILTALFVLGLKLKDNLKVNLSLIIFVSSISLFSFETYLEFIAVAGSPKLNAREKAVLKRRARILEKRKKMASNENLPFDTRSKYEAIDDLKKEGVNIYITTTPNEFIGNEPKINGKTIHPLGGISNKSTGFFWQNENGYWPIYHSDEHGFNNPKWLYNKGEVDIVLLGDSYTEGYSVHSDENMGAVLRRLGLNSVNLGQGGNGPLIEFATLMEYAVPLEPKIVLWVYFEGNDIRNLKGSVKSSLLMQYLKKENFTQNLISRQDEINNVLINFQEKKLKEGDEATKKFRRFVTILKLKNIRSLFGLIHVPSKDIRIGTIIKKLFYKPPITDKDIMNLFTDILYKSNGVVSQWGGKLYFVYLSDYDRYSMKKEEFSRYLKNRDTVLNIVKKLEIPIIDAHTEVFAGQLEPLSLFPFGLHGHYNARGYKLVANAIAKRLKADGMVPSNSNN